MKRKALALEKVALVKRARLVDDEYVRACVKIRDRYYVSVWKKRSIRYKRVKRVLVFLALRHQVRIRYWRVFVKAVVYQGRVGALLRVLCTSTGVRESIARWRALIGEKLLLYKTCGLCHQGCLVRREESEMCRCHLCKNWYNCNEPFYTVVIEECSHCREKWTPSVRAVGPKYYKSPPSALERFDTTCSWVARYKYFGPGSFCDVQCARLVCELNQALRGTRRFFSYYAY